MGPKRVPAAGAVWHGQVITPWRRDLMLRYRQGHNWLITGWGHGTFLAREWTVAERTAFRKWQADFMRPMNGKATKDHSRAR